MYKGNRVVHTKNRPLPHSCEQRRDNGVAKYSGLYRIDNISYSTVSLCLPKGNTCDDHKPKEIFRKPRSIKAAYQFVCYDKFSQSIMGHVESFF